MALGGFFHGLLWSMLVLCSSEKNPDIQVQQPRGPICTQSGAVLTLECEVTWRGPYRAGPVKWFKGEGARRKLIFFNYEYTRLNRVSRKVESSLTDFTIFLHNVVPEDAGIYYCVKQKTYSERGGDLLIGEGTEVFVDCEEKLDYKIPVAATAACVLLVLLISGAVYFCIRKKRGRSRSRHASRPESPLPENEKMPCKDLNAKEIVYAKVEHSKIPQTPKPKSPELLCEYATIQIVQQFAQQV